MLERLPPSTPPGDEPSRDGQDEIDASKAPLLDHLIELRQRLIWALAAFVVMFFACFSVAGHIYNVLVWPYMWASGDETSRLLAFVNIHTMASILPYPFIDLCLKGSRISAHPGAFARMALQRRGVLREVERLNG
ncbi:MAG: twin-arginine translocase subunit TatC, partial [Hyphomicrobium denitrificans]|nr:twin-arginine translocase subunit TatC [Hyphomicrobium denitrificans]